LLNQSNFKQKLAFIPEIKNWKDGKIHFCESMETKPKKFSIKVDIIE